MPESNNRGSDFVCVFSFFEFLNFILFFLYSRFLLVIHFIHISVYVNPNLPIHHHPPHFPPLVSIRLFSTSVSLFLPRKPVHLYRFSRFHIHAFIYDICFSLSDLLHRGSDLIGQFFKSSPGDSMGSNLGEPLAGERGKLTFVQGWCH